MKSCPRCKKTNREDFNYCYFCGIPLNEKTMIMVKRHFENKRRESVHSALSVLIKEGCIKQDKLVDLMSRLEKMFGFRTQKAPQQK